MSEKNMVFLSVVKSDGTVANCAAARGDFSLSFYKAAGARARKLKGDVRQAIVDRESADKLLAYAHVFLMEGRKFTFDELLALARV
jgi:hypothetical protein